MGDLGSIPGSGRSPGEGSGNPLQYSAWEIPWMEEPSRLQSMGLQRVKHNWATSLTLATFITSHLSILYQYTKSWNLKVVIGSMTNLDSILKNRDITLPTKVHLVKTMVFPVVMYGCESWTIKKAEHRRIDAFELWCWRRLLRVPWTERRSNHPILKQISPEYSLEGLMLKLKLQ